ncbi:MAG TPA: PilZ domain-containing protein [Pyrinomonadaceae bacterium]|nr:PilZ domain-containing protein [Pyrinomonadaceae bacterium]
MGRERRRSPRVNVNLPARWEGVLTLQDADITNLSMHGCFVLTGGAVENKELVRVEIILPDDTEISAWGEVVDAANEIGFAVQFTSIPDDELQRLEQFLKQALADT